MSKKTPDFHSLQEIIDFAHAKCFDQKISIYGAAYRAYYNVGFIAKKEAYNKSNHEHLYNTKVQSEKEYMQNVINEIKTFTDNPTISSEGRKIYKRIIEHIIIPSEQ